MNEEKRILRKINGRKKIFKKSREKTLWIQDWVHGRCKKRHPIVHIWQHSIPISPRCFTTYRHIQHSHRVSHQTKSHQDLLEFSIVDVPKAILSYFFKCVIRSHLIPDTFSLTLSSLRDTHAVSCYAQQLSEILAQWLARRYFRFFSLIDSMTLMISAFPPMDCADLLFIFDQHTTKPCNE